MYNVEVRFNKDIRRIMQAATPTLRDMKEAADWVVNTIVERTEQGKDIDGSAFKEYSEPYKKYKEKHNAQSAPPNLMASGDMLGKIVALATSPTRAVVMPTVHAQIGAWHQEGAGRLPQRRWFGLSQKEAAELAREIGEMIKRRLRAA